LINLDKKSVLITGAAGIVGQAAVRECLRRGMSVRAVIFKSRTLDLEHENLEIVRVDLENYDNCLEILKDIDVCLHFAAFIKGAKGQSDAANFSSLVRKNLTPSINMLSAAVEKNIEAVGFIGSSTMYPDTSDAVTEDQAFDGQPHVVYRGVGNMKRYCEKVIQYYGDISKVKFGVIRTTAVYGPFDAFNENGHVIPQLIMRAAKRPEVFDVWGDGKQIRDFVFVQDVVEGLLHVLAEGKSCRPYNIATGNDVTVADLAKLVTREFDYFPELNFDPSKPSMIPIRRVSVKRISEELDWAAKTDIETGIRKTCKWFKENIFED
tara:strand:- start:133510 stop:134475 length:966 start_codon:yes stop_codon:yes gene_type:complete